MQSARFLPLALLSCCAVVAAAPIKWTLTDVSFTDGSTATGSFTFDPDTFERPGTNLTDYQVKLNGGSRLADYLYVPSNPLSNIMVYSYIAPGGRNVEVINPFGRTGTVALPRIVLLYLAPVSFLTNAGGTVLLDPALSTGQLSDLEVSYSIVPLRSGSLVGSSAVPIPEPTSLALVCAGLVAVGLVTNSRDSRRRVRRSSPRRSAASR